jgi:hypothetical protein
MSAEGGNLAGTAIQTTTTMDTVKSAEQIAQESKDRSGESSAKKDDTDSKPQGGLGGMFGGLSKKIGPKKGDDDTGKPRATFMTATHEILKVATDVSPADVAVPAGFKENK